MRTFLLIVITVLTLSCEIQSRSGQPPVSKVKVVVIADPVKNSLDGYKCKVKVINNGTSAYVQLKNNYAIGDTIMVFPSIISY